MTAISIHGLTKRFGSAIAVDSVDLEVRSGELFFLLGPSGCGKTTLLRMIAGFVEPTAGAIRVGDRDVTGLPPNRRNTGMVFQSYALWPHMSVAENVAYGLRVRKVAPAQRRARVSQALGAVHMQEYATRKPAQLSGGQQQRVALARALVVQPVVLLLDEPLSNLDAKLRLEMRAEIRRICKQTGITTVYVTHDQKEALSMADTVALMRAGRVVQTGQPRELYERPRTRFVADFLGETNFLPATVRSIEDSTAVLDTPAGPLRAKVPGSTRHGSPDAGPAAEAASDMSPTLAVGSQVICSIRPEAWRIVAQPGENAIPARHLSTAYFGEVKQHTMEIGDGVSITMTKPSSSKDSDIIDDVVVSIDADDIVIVRE